MSLKKLRSTVEKKQELRATAPAPAVPGNEGLTEIAGAALTAIVGLASWLSGGFLPAVLLWAGTAFLIAAHRNENKIYTYKDMMTIAKGLTSLTDAMVAISRLPLPKDGDAKDAHYQKINAILKQTPFGLSIDRMGGFDETPPFNRVNGELGKLGYSDRSLHEIATAMKSGAQRYLSAKNQLEAYEEKLSEMDGDEPGVIDTADTLYHLQEIFHRYTVELNTICRKLAKSYSKEKPAAAATESYAPGTEGFLDKLKELGKALKKSFAGAPRSEFSGPQFDAYMAGLLKSAKLYDGFMTSEGDHTIATSFVSKEFSIDKAERQFDADSFLEYTPKGMTDLLASLAGLPALLDKCYHLPLATSADGVADYKSRVIQTLQPFFDQWGLRVGDDGSLTHNGYSKFQRIADLSSSVNPVSMVATGWNAKALQSVTLKVTKLRIGPVISAYQNALRTLDQKRDGDAQHVQTQCLNALHRVVSRVLAGVYIANIADVFEKMSYVEYYGSDRAEH